MGARVWNGREWGSWTDGVDQQWIPEGETSADPALWQGNLAAILGNNNAGLASAGYTGPTFNTTNSGGSGDAAQQSNTIAPELRQWLQSSGNTLSGTYLPGEGLLQANVTDAAGKNVASGLNSDAISWGEFLSPVLMAATAGGAGTLLGGSLGLSGNLATAVGNGLIGSGVTALDGGSLTDIAKNGLLAGGASYLGSTAMDALKGTPTTGLDAAQQMAGGSLDVGGLTSDSLAAINNLPDVGIGSSLANFVDTPINVGSADLSALSQVPDFNAPTVNAPSWLQQAASEPIIAPQMPADVQALLQSVPDFNLPAVAPSTFNPAKDSQAASEQLGITGSDAAKSATIPKTVNLTNAGGTMATAGGLLGASNQAAQAIRDAAASSEIGGSALSQAGGLASDALGSVGGAVGDIASWMKQNPTLGRLLLSGAGALLNTVGSGSSGSSSGGSTTYASPVQWTSNPSALNQGLLSGGLLGQNVKQIQPQMPTGLLGNPNSGAWRYLKG